MTHVAKSKCCPRTACPSAGDLDNADCPDSFHLSASGFSFKRCCFCFVDDEGVPAEVDGPTEMGATIVRSGITTNWSSGATGGSCSSDGCGSPCALGQSVGCGTSENASGCSADLRCVFLTEAAATELGLSEGFYWQAEAAAGCSGPSLTSFSMRIRGYVPAVEGHCCPHIGAYPVVSVECFSGANPCTGGGPVVGGGCQCGPDHGCPPPGANEAPSEIVVT